MKTQFGIGSHGSAGEAGLIQGMGLSHVRIDYWTKMASTQYHAEFAARLFDLRNHGLTPLICVQDFFPYGSPLIAANKLMVAADAFPSNTWEIGNEMDADANYTGAKYAALMQVVVPGMKRVDPTCEIVSGGLCCTDGQPWANLPDAVRQPQFVRDYLANGGPMLRAWCIHTYGVPLTMAVLNLTGVTYRALGKLMPLWVTELGVDRAMLEKARGPLGDSTNDSMQADQIHQAMLGMPALVERAYLYDLWDNTNDGFGVVRADSQTLRPSYHTLQEFPK